MAMSQVMVHATVSLAIMVLLAISSVLATVKYAQEKGNATAALKGGVEIIVSVKDAQA